MEGEREGSRRAGKEEQAFTFKTVKLDQIPTCGVRCSIALQFQSTSLVHCPSFKPLKGVYMNKCLTMLTLVQDSEVL